MLVAINSTLNLNSKSNFWDVLTWLCHQ